MSQSYYSYYRKEIALLCPTIKEVNRKGQMKEIFSFCKPNALTMKYVLKYVLHEYMFCMKYVLSTLVNWIN